MELNTELLKMYLKPYEDKIAEQNKLIEALQKNETIEYRSTEIKEIANALAKAQAGFKKAALNKRSAKGLYSDLTAVVDSTREALTKNGLSVIQLVIDYDNGQKTLFTILLHESGQWYESRIRIVPAKNNPQEISSYTTHMKREAYCALVGATTGDYDDDGDSLTVIDRIKEDKGTSIGTYDPEEEPYEPITKEQYEELQYELDGYPDLAKKVLKTFELQSLADMPKSKFLESADKIRKLKALQNGTR